MELKHFWKICSKVTIWITTWLWLPSVGECETIARCATVHGAVYEPCHGRWEFSPFAIVRWKEWQRFGSFRNTRDTAKRHRPARLDLQLSLFFTDDKCQVRASRSNAPQNDTSAIFTGFNCRLRPCFAKLERFEKLPQLLRSNLCYRNFLKLTYDAFFDFSTALKTTAKPWWRQKLWRHHRSSLWMSTEWVETFAWVCHFWSHGLSIARRRELDTKKTQRLPVR